jgi:type II secretion system protein N
MTPRVKKWLTWIGYPFAYICLLGFFARLTFPFERLRDRIVGEFNTKQGPSSRLRIADMSGYWLTGVEASKIELTEAPKSKPGQPIPADAKAKTMTIDAAHVSVSLMRLLFGTTAVSFGADAFGGKLDGKVTTSSSEQTYDFDLEQLNVGQVPFLDELVGLPMKGTLQGTLEVALADKNWAKGEGKVEFAIAGLRVGDGKAKVLNAIALPEINVGNVNLNASVTSGRLKIEKLAAKGSDLDLGVDGGMRLRDPLGTSLLDLSLKFKFSDKYRNKNETTRALLGAPGSTSPGLFELTPQVQRSKRPDGYYGWHIGGTLDHPTFDPSAAAGPSRAPAQ